MSGMSPNLPAQFGAVGQDWRVLGYRRPGQDYAEITDEDGLVQIAAVYGDYREARATLMAAAPALRRALIAAESFVAGFEDDPHQTGVADTLREIRAALRASEGDDL